jgi:hypothetical protein
VPPSNHQQLGTNSDERNPPRDGFLLARHSAAPFVCHSERSEESPHFAVACSCSSFWLLVRHSGEARISVLALAVARFRRCLFLHVIPQRPLFVI